MLFSLPPATKLGQGYVFTRICDSVHGGGWYPSMHCKWYPSMPCPQTGVKLTGLAWGVSTPTPGGKLRGLAWGGLQVHTQGGLQAHTQRGLQAHTRWGVSRQTPRRLLLREVRILVECILVPILFAKICARIKKSHCFSKRKLNLKKALK